MIKLGQYLSSWLAFLGLATVTGIKISFQVSVGSSWIEANSVTVTNHFTVQFLHPGWVFYFMQKQWCLFLQLNFWHCPQFREKYKVFIMYSLSWEYYCQHSKVLKVLFRQYHFGNSMTNSIKVQTKFRCLSHHFTHHQHQRWIGWW